MVEDNHVPEGYKVLKEGKANLLYIEEKMEVDDKAQNPNTVRTPRNLRILFGFKAESRMLQVEPLWNPTSERDHEINETRGAVFYNPVQEFNRDTSILVINEFNELLKEERLAKNKEHDGVKVFEALAATGLRSVRYMKEIPSITKLVGNDIDSAATDLMKKNFAYNQCPEEKY